MKKLSKNKSMQKYLTILILSLSLAASAQERPQYAVTGWHYEDSLTCMQIQFAWGKQIVFKADSNHLNQVQYVLDHGCALTRKSASLVFPLTDLQYVTEDEEGKIESSLHLLKLCNREH